jgi:hypothetical protein
VHWIRPRLEQQQQHLPPDAAKTMARRHCLRAAIVDGDVVPKGEVSANRSGADRVVAGEVRQGLVGEHHAPAERIVRPVPLDHDDLVIGVFQLHRDREIEPGGTTAETHDPHRSGAFCCSICRTRRELFQASN